MIYITVKADYDGHPIKDTYSGEIALCCAGLSKEFQLKIKIWNIDYEKIILMSPAERLENRELIELLDLEGVDICRGILKELGGEVKIQYYSEGRLKFTDFLSER